MYKLKPPVLASSVINNRISSTVGCVLYGWLLGGLLLIVLTLLGISWNPTLVNSPHWVNPIIGVLLVSGSFLVLLSGIKWKNISTAWKLELTGLPLLIAAWGLHATVIIYVEDGAVFLIVLSIAYIAAVLSRFHKLKVEQLEIRKAVESYENQLDGGVNYD